MRIVENKAEKNGVISYVKLRRSLLIQSGNLYLKLSSQLDLAFLRDHKNMLLLEFLDGKGVVVLPQVLANLRFCVSVFLNFAKGMICNYYKSFVVVVSPLTSLIWMKD